MNISDEVSDFLKSHSILIKALDIKVTSQINDYLMPYWQGTTEKINWEKIDSNFVKVAFDEYITKESVNELVTKYNFTALLSNDLLLYYSATKPCFLVNNDFYRKYLFDFMNKFCFLDTVLLFNILDSNTKCNVSDNREEE